MWSSPALFNAADIGSAIPRFESWRPSQPVRSLRRVWHVSENLRCSRGLACGDVVSDDGSAESGARTADFQAPVSARQFSISVRVPGETGSILKRDWFVGPSGAGRLRLGTASYAGWCVLDSVVCGLGFVNLGREAWQLSRGRAASA
jgi:hypothetical protein